MLGCIHSHSCPHVASGPWVGHPRLQEESLGCISPDFLPSLKEPPLCARGLAHSSPSLGCRLRFSSLNKPSVLEEDLADFLSKANTCHSFLQMSTLLEDRADWLPHFGRQVVTGVLPPHPRPPSGACRELHATGNVPEAEKDGPSR